MIETGVIQLDNDKSKTALVFGQMNEPPGARARVALTGLTIAEYFRDDEGQDVLLFIDNIFRFTQGTFHTLYFLLVLALIIVTNLFSWFRGVCASRTYSFRCRIPTYSFDRHGRYARTYHHHQEGIDHLCTGRLRPR